MEREHPFEIGPIRPPNEANSLLVRVTRNCPHNRCAFCPVYKGQRFSLRSAEDVIADIDAMADIADEIERIAEALDPAPATAAAARELALRALLMRHGGNEALQVGLFVLGGARHAFLQDANTLVLKTERLLPIVHHLVARFPSLTRITSYARSHTLVRRSVAELAQLRAAGLDRIHVGIESGADSVLQLAAKGVDAAKQIDGGLRAKEAGMELSCYVMPGLGGRALSGEHLHGTAAVLRAVDPHFIRLRTLAIPPASPLAELEQDGDFEPLGEVEIAAEIRALLAQLEGLHGTVRSDHILNLLEGVAGELPGDLPRMLQVLDRFLELPGEQQELFIVGRRLGLWRQLDELGDEERVERAAEARERLLARYPGRSLDQAIRALMTRFV